MSRIVYFGNFVFPDKNAAAHRVLNNGIVLKKLGHEVIFVAAGKQSEKDFVNGFKVIYYKYVSKLDKCLYYFGSIAKKVLKNQLTNADYVVVYNAPSLVLKWLIKQKRRLGFQLISDITEWYEKKGIFAYDTKMRMEKLNFQSDGLIVISKFLFDYYNAKVKCIIVPPIVNTSMQAIQKKLKTKNNLIFFGTISQRKERLDVIVDAVSYNGKCNLYVLGCSKEEFCLTYRKISPVSDCIHFLGKRSHKESIEHLLSSDYFVFLRDDNLTTRAGFSTKLAESLAFGIPVITNHSISTDAYIEERKNGYFVKDIDYISVSTTLDEAFDNKIVCLRDQRFTSDYYLSVFETIFGKN